jgi:probable HAF family extracellular repeat protein
MSLTRLCHAWDSTLCRSVLLLALIVLVPVSAQAQYTFTVLDVDFRSGRDALYGCAATGINDQGVIVGVCNDANRADAARGFSYDGRRFTEITFLTVKGRAAVAAQWVYRNAPFQLGKLRSLRTISGLVPQDINASKQVTGWYVASGVLKGFLKKPGAIIASNVVVPNALFTEPIGINDAGHVVGDYRSADGAFHAFLYVNGVFTSFGDDLGATDINNDGQIVGCYASCSRGFLYNGTTYTPIDVPGAVITQPHGINDDGHIVGTYHDGTTSRGFLYDGTGFTTINAPGASATNVSRINNGGDIVGYYLTEPSPGVFEHHAFVAKR